jgi:hypothetical protein
MGAFRAVGGTIFIITPTKAFFLREIDINKYLVGT